MYKHVLFYIKSITKTYKTLLFSFMQIVVTVIIAVAVAVAVLIVIVIALIVMHRKEKLPCTRKVCWLQLCVYIHARNTSNESIYYKSNNSKHLE